MSINGMDGLGDALDEFERQALDLLYEDMAQSVAESARESGLSSTHTMVFELEADASGFVVDEARVRRRADEILGGR